MVQIIREANMDVVKRGATRPIYAKQHDRNSRFLNVRIQEEGNDLKIESTSTVMLNVSRPDKQLNVFKGSVNDDGSVRIPLTAWMLELEGTLTCDISIVDGDVARLTTMQFNIYVEASVCNDDAMEDTEEYSIIVDLLNRVEDAAKLAEAAAADATALREACLDATASAKKATEDANNALNEIKKGGYILGVEETNHGEIMTFWMGTQAEYDALTEKYNSCMYIITDDATDMVVESGTSDGWTYRKWSSGIVECWKRITKTVNALELSDDWYSCSLQENLPENMFKSANDVNITPVFSDSPVTSTIHVNWFSADYVAWYMSFRTAKSHLSLDFTISAKGTWK